MCNILDTDVRALSAPVRKRHPCMLIATDLCPAGQRSVELNNEIDPRRGYGLREQEFSWSMVILLSKFRQSSTHFHRG